MLECSDDSELSESISLNKVRLVVVSANRIVDASDADDCIDVVVGGVAFISVRLRGGVMSKSFG